ncbi:hypothetical protein [Cellvibrio sp. PSBB006]|uniref:hypothetical protein n=1 Tax=Cellvibrio sp. PSBB006 TaxID=1987723 RepID=UPI0012FA9384|nr:hypothetical protein [Cellvibrio sp. PSBB006]
MGFSINSVRTARATFNKQRLVKGLFIVMTGVMLAACSPDKQTGDDHGHPHGSGADHQAHGDDSHDHGDGMHTHEDAPETEAFYGDEAEAAEAPSITDEHTHSSDAHEHSHTDGEHDHGHDH